MAIHLNRFLKKTMRRPLFYPFLALIAGIWIGDHVTFPFSGLAFLSLAILLSLFLSIRKRWNQTSFGLIIFFVFVTGLVSISRYQSLHLDTHHVMHHCSSDRLTIEGIVQSQEQISPEKSLLLIECVRRISGQTCFTLRGKIRLVVPSGLLFEAGDFVRFRTVVKAISGFRNPGGFDYQKHLKRQGVFASGSILGPQDIIVIRRHWNPSLSSTVDHFRQSLKRLIDSNADTPEREILEAMTIGNQKAIPADIRDAFSQTGTSHILSISGLHVGMVASAGFLLIFGLLKSSEYLMLRFHIIKIAAATSMIPVFIYTLVAGMGTPVLRSAIMAVSFIIALMIGKLRDPYNVLLIAAFIILIIFPESLFEMSFQLSFSAVFALIYIVPRFSPLPASFLIRAPRPIRFIAGQAYLFVLVSFAATLGTLPIILYYFNRLSTITILANIILVPLLGMLTLFLVFLFILAATFSPMAAAWFIKAASFSTSQSIAVIKRLSSLPWSSITFVKPNEIEIVLLYIFLFGVIQILTPTSRSNHQSQIATHPVLIRISVSAAFLLLLVHGLYLYWKDQTSNVLKLTVLDVGQGASSLVEFPQGVKMLIDGGGVPDSSFDMGKSVVAPFLHDKRIRKIDIVVLTHPHPDHLQGLIYILDHFHVGEVWTTPVKSDDDLYRRWERTLSNRKVNVRYLTAQTPPRDLASVRIEPLWPDYAVDKAHLLGTNDQSLVFKISFGETSFLVTGDISSQVESQLLSCGKALKSDLLLVPHHGSVHSSSVRFIQAVSPRHAIISTGKNNVFRHPHPQVLDRYRSMGVSIFRTDSQGAILVQSDGKKMDVSAYRDSPFDFLRCLLGH